MELITGDNDKGRRLDRILRKALPDYPLPLLHRLLRQKKVLVDGKPAKAEDRLDSGVKISIPLLSGSSSDKPSVSPHIKSRSKSLPDILWEGSGLLAVNKPPGVTVHGKDSLDDMVQSYLADKLPPSLSFKSGPLHRLDKPSSGIVVFSTSLQGARLFSSLLREHKVRKTYLAIVEGNMEKELFKESRVWEDTLVRDKVKKKTFVSGKMTSEETAGKKAITTVIPLATATFKGKPYTLITAEITTGRTHQIRAQAASHGYPLAGDVKYGGRTASFAEDIGFDSGFFLHAWKLEFLDNLIEAPLPQGFRKTANVLFNKEL